MYHIPIFIYSYIVVPAQCSPCSAPMIMTEIQITIQRISSWATNYLVGHPYHHRTLNNNTEIIQLGN